jgi:hypothetical protein
MTENGQAQFVTWLGSLAASLLLFGVAPAQAQRPSVPPPAPVATYADMADLAEAAAIVALVEVRRQTLVPPARAPGLAPGQARLYIEARTEALLAGRSALGESLVYLADVPLMSNGKPPKLRKERFLVFADPVPGRPGSLQLVAPEAQLPATPEIEQLARTVLAELAAPDVPPRLTGVRDVMSVAGNLAGESETQLFLGTTTGAPVSLTVIRRPGMAPEWGVSWSEIVDQAARPPARESIEWYRLACFLPQQIPAEAFLQSDQASRRQAEADYRFILDQLGECRRLHA